jgi:hypothetical protein
MKSVSYITLDNVEAKKGTTIVFAVRIQFTHFFSLFTCRALISNVEQFGLVLAMCRQLHNHNWWHFKQTIYWKKILMDLVAQWIAYQTSDRKCSLGLPSRNYCLSTESILTSSTSYVKQ